MTHTPDTTMHLISVRLDTETLNRLDDLARHRFPAIAKANPRYLPFKHSRSDIIRRAIKLGLTLLTERPLSLHKETEPCRNGKAYPRQTLADPATASSARLPPIP